MKNKYSYIFLTIFLFINFILSGSGKELPSKMVVSDDVATFKNLLRSLKDNAGNELFKVHFQSMLDVIDAKGVLTYSDSVLIQATLPAFSDQSVSGNASELSSYFNRSRPLVISWVSPTDGKVSFFRLRLPKNWDPDKSYPLYIELHGLWSVANNPVEFMTYSFRKGPSTSFEFEDGYQILPWGRGNLWYIGISETDIWEGIARIEMMLKIDQSRKYLTGHSMGGFGAWRIASQSADVWAAVGIHAGALGYASDMLSDERINNLSEMPTYFVCGDNDGLLDVNLRAYNKLYDTGNSNVEFVTFPGAHDYLTVNVENMYLWLKEFENENYTGFLESKVMGDDNVLICPNPVQSEASIHINLEKQGHIRLNLYNAEGKKVATMIRRKLMCGESIIKWERGFLSPGIYTYSFSTGQTNKNGKLVLN